MQLILALAGNDVDKWHHAMLRVIYTHNGHENETTGLSPYQMVFGTVARTVEGVFRGQSATRELGKENVTQE